MIILGIRFDWVSLCRWWCQTQNHSIWQFGKPLIQRLIHFYILSIFTFCGIFCSSLNVSDHSLWFFFNHFHIKRGITATTSEKEDSWFPQFLPLRAALNKWEYNLRAAHTITTAAISSSVGRGSSTIVHSLNQLTPCENCVYCFIAIIEFRAWQLLIRMLIWIGWNQFCYFFRCCHTTTKAKTPIALAAVSASAIA